MGVFRSRHTTYKLVAAASGNPRLTSQRLTVCKFGVPRLTSSIYLPDRTPRNPLPSNTANAVSRTTLTSGIRRTDNGPGLWDLPSQRLTIQIGAITHELTANTHTKAM